VPPSTEARHRRRCPVASRESYPQDEGPYPVDGFGLGCRRRPATMGRFGAVPMPSRIGDQFLCRGAAATSNFMSALMIRIGTVTRTLTLGGH